MSIFLSSLINVIIRNIQHNNDFWVIYTHCNIFVSLYRALTNTDTKYITLEAIKTSTVELGSSKTQKSWANSGLEIDSWFTIAGSSLPVRLIPDPYLYLHTHLNVGREMSNKITDRFSFFPSLSIWKIFLLDIKLCIDSSFF